MRRVVERGTVATGPRRRVRPIAGAGAYAMVVGLWVCFGLATLALPDLFDATWSWVRGLPWYVEAIAWVLLLPWMVAAAIWQSTLMIWVRVVLVVVIAMGTITMFSRGRTPD